MKRLILALALCPLALFAKTTYYDLVMTMRVPVIVDNSKSRGKRVGWHAVGDNWREDHGHRHGRRHSGNVGLVQDEEENGVRLTWRE